MRLVFFANHLNHHQVRVADEFYRILGDDFCFVATLPHDRNALKGGADYSGRPYCCLAAPNAKSVQSALSLACEADVCVFGADSQMYAIERAKKNPEGLSFEMGERWLKHGWLTIGSKVFRRWLLNYLRYFRKGNFYKLCCSSFAATDDRKLSAYKGRHFKWGYFTEIPANYVDSSLSFVSRHAKVKILWCARFLLLKHPELAILLAEKLKRNSYDFSIDLYGDEGDLAPYDKVFTRTRLEKLIIKYGVEDYVNLKGNRPNSEVLQAMQEGDIFLFTSNRLEGWGAVANEAMASGCVLVASDAIGSTHYLVKHKETGMIFKSGNIYSLYEQVKYLIDHPQERVTIAKAGKQSMAQLWSPANAAKSLLQLIEDLKAGKDTSILTGPCSKA